MLGTIGLLHVSCPMKMTRRSPTLEGFTAMVRWPSLGLAEIAWRWSFGFAAMALGIFSLGQYLDTLPVTNRDLWFLRSRHPLLVSQALARIFQGSGSRLVLAALILFPALALAWILLGSLGRAATLKALVGYFRVEADNPPRPLAERPFRSLAGLSFLRVAVTFSAMAGCLGAVFLAARSSPKSDPSPGAAFLIFLTVLMLVWLAWSVLNWFLSIASVFVVSGGKGTFGALASAVELCRTRTGVVAAAGTWFGLAHIAAFFIATSALGFPLAFLPLLPAGVVLGGVLLVTLLYFAVADFLYVGRLAAYVAILELPVPPKPEPIVAPPLLIVNTPAVGVPAQDSPEAGSPDAPPQASPESPPDVPQT